jgi:hypothetical protein
MNREEAERREGENILDGGRVGVLYIKGDGEKRVV